MPLEDTPDLPSPTDAAPPRRSWDVTPGDPEADRLIRLSARVGIWGFAVAFVPLVVGSLGAILSPAVVSALAGAGFLVSGVGTAVAAFAVWRRKPPALLRTASLLGMPLGALLGALGLGALLGLDLVGSAGLALPVVGSVVVVLLLVSFVVYGGRGS